ncbi:MAG: tRNA (adenosine(37)-N6)-dimethylallyltransferase MiaA [Candidatus Paceibacterota bacterium]
MDTHAKTKIIVIVGPTGSGKTALAIKIATKFKGEIISADSRQVYRNLDIGTEKVTHEEMAGIQHHLIDITDIQTVYTASDFKKDAEKIITHITKNNKLPIIAGGTFFYIDTLLKNIPTADIPPDPELREQLEMLPTEKLFIALQELDPKRAMDIDPHNRRRVIRALEVIEAIGQVPSRSDSDLNNLYDVLCIGIEIDREVLRTRLKMRAEHAVERGLVEETKSVLATGVSKERLTEIGHEYAVVLEYLDGKFGDAELLQKLEEKNWQYAKRQWTWLKKMENVNWFQNDDPAIITAIENFLRR